MEPLLNSTNLPKLERLRMDFRSEYFRGITFALQLLLQPLRQLRLHDFLRVMAWIYDRETRRFRVLRRMVVDISRYEYVCPGERSVAVRGPIFHATLASPPAAAT